MRTSPAGKRSNADAGVSLLEMLVVVSLMAVMIGIIFPAVTTGLESLRLRSAAESIVANLNAALTRSQRFQDAVDVGISARHHTLITQTIRTNVVRELDLPEGIQISRILPEGAPGTAAAQDGEDAGILPDRHFVIYPDGAVPRILIELTNRKGTRRLVVVDPITGVARDRVLTAAQTLAQVENQDETEPGGEGAKR